ncbi:hypothetical protein [Neisseria canis]|uniref:hypothetical protein n=1 Tax=Neisseria canis TaxID=493 RepID=UPI001301B867|nr:hypothetical protein [Neisseria canis]
MQTLLDCPIKAAFFIFRQAFSSSLKTRFLLICGRFKPIIRSGLFLPETTL